MSKGYLQSQTIVGGIKMAIPIMFQVLALIGLDLTDLESQVTETVISLVTSILGLWGLYDVIVGRIKATKSIDTGVAFK